MTIMLSHGEELRVPERVIVAPALGVFRPALPAENGNGRHVVNEGQVIGVVQCGSRAVAVQSPFTGLLMGMLADPGERVREGQPVAWLRSL